jgi:hypothetical protein
MLSMMVKRPSNSARTLTFGNDTAARSNEHLYMSVKLHTSLSRGKAWSAREASRRKHAGCRNTGIHHVGFTRRVPVHHARFVEKNIPIKFVFNHRVSFAFYFDDPVGNKIEVYWPPGDLSCTQPYAEPLDLSRTRRCLRRLRKIDDYISRVGLAAPTESIPRLLDGYQQEELTELNLQQVGISTVMWATGYAFDFSFVKLPVVDSDRYPIQKRGVTRYPGLYFCPGCTAEGREFCSVSETMLLIWQHILPRATHSAGNTTRARVSYAM